MNIKNIVVIVLVAAICALAIKFYYVDERVAERASADENVVVESSSPEANVALNETEQKIADLWQWQEEKAETETDEDNVPPLFTEQSVHNALQAVRLDENGDVVQDYDAQIALDEALERIYKQLDPESLLELQDIIKNALPGKVGEQTAQLVEDYKGFLQARDQFSQVHENAPDAFSQETVAGVDQDAALYNELKSLRQLHLGRETADNLFAVADANAAFMFDNMRLEFDRGLSPQERAARRQEIEAHFQREMEAHLPPQEEGISNQ